MLTKSKILVYSLYDSNMIFFVKSSKYFDLVFSTIFNLIKLTRLYVYSDIVVLLFKSYKYTNNIKRFNRFSNFCTVQGRKFPPVKKRILVRSLIKYT